MHLTRRALLSGPVPALALAVALPSVLRGAETTAFRLLMVEQRGCFYCEKWKKEIGPVYGNTTEASVAPLEHVDLRGTWPEGIAIGSRPVFTPTFILLKDNVEVGRLEGYAGEDFFWGLLDEMLIEAGADLTPDGVSVGTAGPAS